jgi:hypothetical protein
MVVRFVCVPVCPVCACVSRVSRVCPGLPGVFVPEIDSSQPIIFWLSGHEWTHPLHEGSIGRRHYRSSPKTPARRISYINHIWIMGVEAAGRAPSIRGLRGIVSSDKRSNYPNSKVQRNRTDGRTYRELVAVEGRSGIRRAPAPRRTGGALGGEGQGRRGTENYTFNTNPEVLKIKVPSSRHA